MPNPVIPEQIVVHLGAPDSDAINVTESFSDYIKNVASSEIYPTWPNEAIKANIIAQISGVKHPPAASHAGRGPLKTVKFVASMSRKMRGPNSFE